MSAPRRTCLGCRAVKSQGELWRLAVARKDGVPTVVWDRRRALGGRGAWLCRGSQACLDQAVKKNAFGRAFRAGALDLREIIGYNSEIQSDRRNRDGQK